MRRCTRRRFRSHQGRTRAIEITKWKEATLKALIVLVPTYSMAWFTGQMVWVVPTLAACGFFAGTITLDSRTTTQRLEDDANAQNATELDQTVDLDVDQEGSN